MSVDVVLEGGRLADGTGGPSRLADVALAGERIVAIAEPGTLAEAAARRLDVTGLVVAPGFVDVHTHLDAQVMWDPSCSPVVHHGVTTAIAGNCGFSIAPLVDDGVGYVMRMLASVEEIPLASLERALSWDWRSTAEYLDRVEAAQPVINMAFMVGHSALRRAVMGVRAVGEVATDTDVERMSDLLRQSLAAGGLGFSSSWQTVHVDGEGAPVPSRWASADELVALSSVVREQPGTLVGFIPALEGHRSFDQEMTELLTRMSLAAQRTVNWNIFTPGRSDREGIRSLLNASDHASRAGARVVALSYPGIQEIRRTFPGSRYAELPGWDELLSLPPDAQKRALADPVERDRWRALAETPQSDRSVHPLARWAQFAVAEGFTDWTRRLEGRLLGEIAAEQGRAPFDVLCDIAVADDLRTGLLAEPVGTDAESWAVRLSSWTDPRIVLGASDAGAHVHTLATFDWATKFLSLNREHQVLSLEQAVHRVTGRQAAVFGLVDRGFITEGYLADIVVFDPDVIAPERARLRQDFPAGASRLFGAAKGIAHVFVNGTEVLRDGQLTGDARGHVLRSGRDTRTVKLH
jgi:N-acyl-D-aspartate/D-glutamate deacylase